MRRSLSALSFRAHAHAGFSREQERGIPKESYDRGSTIQSVGILHANDRRSA